MSALSMTTAVTAKVAIAGKSVVSKRNVAAAPSKRGQLVRARSFIFLLAFSARCRRGAILFLAALCGIFSKKILGAYVVLRFYAERVHTSLRAHRSWMRFCRERVLFVVAFARADAFFAHKARYRLISPFSPSAVRERKKEDF